MIALKDIFETKDVSYVKDKSVLKKCARRGEGNELPKDCAKVKLSVEEATDGSAPIKSFFAKVLEFTAGNGEVCDALEWAISDMRRGERAVVSIFNNALAKEAQLGLQDIAANKIMLTVEMTGFEQGPVTQKLSEEEKLEHGAARKEVGTALFKGGRIAL